MTADGRVARKLEEWKRRLIDLSRRNRLIHFRPSKASSLRIFDEHPPEILRLVAVQGASMGFAPRPQDRSASTQVYRPAASEDRHVDKVLQSDVEEERLDDVLLQVYRKASAIFEEHGTSTLFLALGFVEWFEDDAAAEPCHSPLLLVPVELARTSVRAEFKLRAREEEPVLNPALARRLKRDFGVEFPALPDDFEEFDARAWFDGAAAALQPLKRGRLTDSIYLGLFSFTKFFMFKDLELQSERFAAHPLIRLLAGDAEAGAALPRDPVPEAAELDRRPPAESFQVLDADSSQQEAIEAAKAGRHLVIEGPPGTGKSQTIANLISEFLLAGRTVLFISEKMAALRVVHDRLQRVGLGDFCLELHSQKTAKGRVTGEIARTLELPRDGEEVRPEVLERLAAERAALAEYVRQLHEAEPPLGLTPYEAFAVMARHESTPEVPAVVKGARAWTRERVESAADRVRALASARRAVDPVTGHPWFACLRTQAAYETELELKAALDEAVRAGQAAERAAVALASGLGSRSPATIEEARALDRIGGLMSAGPGPDHSALDGGKWTDAAAVEELTEPLEEFHARRGEILARYDAAILETEVEPIFRWWLDHGESLLKFARPSFWRFRGILRRLRKPAAVEERTLADLDTAVQVRALRRKLTAADGAVFGGAWNGPETDPKEAARLAGWFAALRNAKRLGLVTPELLARIPAGGDVPSAGATLDAWESSIGRLRELLQNPGWNPAIAEGRAAAERMRRSMDRLAEWVRYRAARAAVAQGDTESFAAPLDGIPPELHDAVFERQFHRCWLEEIFAARPALGRFDPAEQDRRVASFRELDRKVVELNRLRARGRLLRELPDPAYQAGAGSDLGTLQREVRKKRGQMPLRRLIRSTWKALRKAKPCFMMSPLSVAQYLDPEGEPFDLVVYDEASQVSPEDAVGSIARGRQVVVVGDSRQLPPTSFFQFESREPDADLEEEAEDRLESILDECATLFPERKMLRWHYRSRHEDLIAFSNRTFYGNRLVTFPAADDDGGRRGVEFVHVADGVYDRGGSGANPAEARRVADAVFEWLKANPDRSAGVGAFGIKQQQAIEDALEERRRADPSIEPRFDYNAPDYCFVKNLETIQGDERDVIFLSVGYGRGADGKVSMNFGPINQQGGSRRLNVLVTRAREKVIVFSSILPEDIDLSKTQAEGAKHLREYLEYARGARTEPSAEGTSRASGTEASIERALRTKGLAVEREVGRSEYRIDLAVREGDRRLLAVEGDGPSYRAGATTRDRERLRPQVLQALGWRVHRVWSPAWFRSPARELERILKEVEAAKAGAPRAEPAVELGNLTVKADAGSDSIAPYRTVEVRRFGRAESMADADPAKLAEAAARVVESEGPIHRDVLLRRIADHWESPRMTAKIQEAADAGAARAGREGWVVRRDDFYWSPKMKEPPLRRRDSDGAPRDAEHIAPEELAAAILFILRKEYRVASEDLPDRAARLLGFARGGAKVRESLAAAVAMLRREGRIMGERLIELRR